MIKTFRHIALFEGITTVALFFIAMPMKYFADIPKAVSIVGAIHGFAFVVYVLALFVTFWGRNLGLGAWFRTGIASVFPLGTFLNDPYLKRLEARWEG